MWLTYSEKDVPGHVGDEWRLFQQVGYKPGEGRLRPQSPRHNNASSFGTILYGNHHKTYFLISSAPGAGLQNLLIHLFLATQN